MHHDPKLENPRDPATIPPRGLCRPIARTSTDTFRGWGPKLG
jgi:hypothetical protein